MSGLSEISMTIVPKGALSGGVLQKGFIEYLCSPCFKLPWTAALAYSAVGQENSAVWGYVVPFCLHWRSWRLMPRSFLRCSSNRVETVDGRCRKQVGSNQGLRHADSRWPANAKSTIFEAKYMALYYLAVHDICQSGRLIRPLQHCLFLTSLFILVEVVTRLNDAPVHGRQ